MTPPIVIVIEFVVLSVVFGVYVWYAFLDPSARRLRRLREIHKRLQQAQNRRPRNLGKCVELLEEYEKESNS